MNRSKKVKKLSQEKKAGLYMLMGVALEIITFLWSVQPFIPEVAIIGIVLVGIVPVIKMIKSDFSEPSEREKIFWNKAAQKSVALLFALLIFYWLFICIDRLIDLPISADVCYLIPYLVGVAYLFTGYHFKLYKMIDEYEQE